MGRHVQESVALSKEQIEGLVRDVANAAHRAVEAGFDGIQFHGAHGYLASKFLTPYFNQRTDEYGGSLETGPASSVNASLPSAMPSVLPIPYGLKSTAATS